MIRHRPPRRGFTLIELLVVIAILAILSALTAAGIGRLRSAQQTRNTEATLTKLQKALDAQRQAIIDQCKQDRLKGNIPAAILTFCGNDKDMAEALWVYVNLKRELPETFAEALGDVCPNPAQLAGTSPFSGPDLRRGIWLWFPASTNNPAVYILPPRATFSKFNTAGSGATAPTYIPPESAALLHQILSEKGLKGMAIGADDSTAGAQTTIPVGGGTFQVFTDTWGNPIWFNRLANFAELQGQPYVSANLSASPNRDPIDPLGKLFSLSVAQKAAIQMMVGAPIDGSNKMSSVYSAGPNKLADVVYTPGNTAADDVFGFRLRRQGVSGG